jgi:RNA-directed DNA polymerase
VRSSHCYDFVPKRTGPPRLSEEPKPHTKSIQCKILDEILARVPIHDAAHGFLAGRSCITSVSRHACDHLIVAMDLKDSCPSTPVGRIDGLFRALGYPPAATDLLRGLVTTCTPKGRSFRASRPGSAMT